MQQVTVELPKAFSVRDENEFYAFQHLISRMNPQLRVTQVTTGVHVTGGCTVFWGLVHVGDRTLARRELLMAMEEAGFDLHRNRPIPKLDMVSDEEAGEGLRRHESAA